MTLVESSSAQGSSVKAVLSMVRCSHLNELLLADTRCANKCRHLRCRHGVTSTVLKGLTGTLMVSQAGSGGLARGASDARSALGLKLNTSFAARA